MFFPWSIIPGIQCLRLAATTCLACQVRLYRSHWHIGHSSAPSYLVTVVHLAMLVLSCMLFMYFFCSACCRRSFTACGLCEFICSFPSMSLRIVFLKSHVKLYYAANLFASLNRESLFLLIFSISWALTTCSLMSFPWLM